MIAPVINLQHAIHTTCVVLCAVLCAVVVHHVVGFGLLSVTHHLNPFSISATQTTLSPLSTPQFLFTFLLFITRNMSRSSHTQAQGKKASKKSSANKNQTHSDPTIPSIPKSLEDGGDGDVKLASTDSAIADAATAGSAKSVAGKRTTANTLSRRKATGAAGSPTGMKPDEIMSLLDTCWGKSVLLLTLLMYILTLSVPTGKPDVEKHVLAAGRELLQAGEVRPAFAALARAAVNMIGIESLPHFYFVCH